MQQLLLPALAAAASLTLLSLALWMAATRMFAEVERLPAGLIGIFSVFAAYHAALAVCGLPRLPAALWGVIIVNVLALYQMRIRQTGYLLGAGVMIFLIIVQLRG